jgi:hypothetical protein
MSNKQQVLAHIEQYGSCNTTDMIGYVKPQLTIDEIRYALKTLKADKLVEDKGGIWSLSKNSFTSILSSRLWNGGLFA